MNYGPRTLAALATFAAICGTLAPGRAETTSYARGPILGTTTLELDIEVGSGIDRADVRFDMDENPVVYVTTAVPRASLRDGTVVGIVTRRGAPQSARTLLVYASATATYPWDAPHGDIRVERGAARFERHGASLDVTLATRSGARRFALGASVPIVSVGRGSRADLRSPRPALVIATQKTYDIHGTVRAVVVGDDGAPVVPL